MLHAPLTQSPRIAPSARHRAPSRAIACYRRKSDPYACLSRLHPRGLRPGPLVRNSGLSPRASATALKSCSSMILSARRTALHEHTYNPPRPHQAPRAEHDTNNHYCVSTCMCSPGNSRSVSRSRPVPLPDMLRSLACVTPPGGRDPELHPSSREVSASRRCLPRRLRWRLRHEARCNGEQGSHHSINGDQANQTHRRGHRPHRRV